jgi:glycosyltransferase involved in cell wall biosynthesis
MRVSVIIPCFNEGPLLQEAVQSATAGDPRPDELIVVNDGSSDPETLRILAQLETQGIRVIHQANAGLANARNAGVRAASGDIVIPLDADNRLRAEMLRFARSTFQERPRVGVMYGDALFFGAKTGRWVVGPFELRRLLYWNYIDACAAYRREVWERNGGYDAGMPCMGFEDWDFWLGAAEQGWEFAYIPEILFEYRVREGSMISRAFHHQRATGHYVARKHAPLYWETYRQLMEERNSVRPSLANVARVIKRRALRRKVIIN